MTSSGSISYEDLISEGERLVESIRPQEAVAVFRRALDLRPADTSAMDALGEVLVSLDEREEARSLFSRSVELAPTSGFSKWMYLGQLSCGEEAARCFQCGLNLIKKELDGCAGGDSATSGLSISSLKLRLSEAFCSLTELYMTDLCDEPDAQGKCLEYSAAALEACEENPEAHQVTASLYLVLQRTHEAQEHLKRTCAIIQELESEEEGEGEEGLEEELGDGESGSGSLENIGSKSFGCRSDAEAGSGVMRGSEESGSMLEEPSKSPPRESGVMPSQEFRLHTARMCMEAELYVQAGHLLNVLLAEDDTDMEVWFLAGEAALLSGDSEYSVELLTTAEAMLTAALSVGGKKGGARDAQRAASSVASSNSVIDFSQAAISALLATPPATLAEQQSMVRSLLEKSLEAQAREQEKNSLLVKEPAMGEQ